MKSPISIPVQLILQFSSFILQNFPDATLIFTDVSKSPLVLALHNIAFDIHTTIGIGAVLSNITPSLTINSWKGRSEIECKYSTFEAHLDICSNPFRHINCRSSLYLKMLYTSFETEVRNNNAEISIFSTCLLYFDKGYSTVPSKSILDREFKPIWDKQMRSS